MEVNTMAKMTKKQDQLYLKLVALHHEMIRAKHFNKKDEFDEVIDKIREEVDAYGTDVRN